MKSDIIGVIATSRAGRDKGRSFLVVEVLDEAHVLLSDGETHKMAHPKKKKLKHLHFENARADMTSVPEGGKGAMDSYIRKCLRDLGYDHLGANKEG